MEMQWKDTLHQALLNLTTTLLQHYTKVIKAKRDPRQNIYEYLTQLKRKHTDSKPNLIPSTSKQVLLPTPKQPHLQQNPPADFTEALTGLINTYSKTDPNSNYNISNTHANHNN